MGDQLTSDTLKILIKIQMSPGSGGVIRIFNHNRQTHLQRPLFGGRVEWECWVHHPPFSAWEQAQIGKCHDRHWHSLNSKQKRKPTLLTDSTSNSPTSSCKRKNFWDGWQPENDPVVYLIKFDSRYLENLRCSLDMILDQRVHWSVAQFLTHYIVLLFASLFHSTVFGILCFELSEQLRSSDAGSMIGIFLLNQS